MNVPIPTGHSLRRNGKPFATRLLPGIRSVLLLVGFWPLLASPAAQAQQATLLIRSDTTCNLTVNAVSGGQVQAGVAKAVKVAGGEQLIECTAGASRVEKVLTVEPGNQKVVTLSLALAVRFQILGEGMVRDTQSGLVWTQQDNRYDIDWEDAQRYCANLTLEGASWSLPRLSELSTLVGRATDDGSPFRLSISWFWSSERNGSAEA